ncbi:respiratory nitrate reductase subunit gamma [Phenylobacterium sp.]|uniref:respiratory nitrate reductase subunit gamma n=1 Tax=Phenylobacterium sp. TaxID=1871053 RepID=UPI00086ECFA3|nr:MAG: respiratory nitrate reductase subunit gamma [Phenylobacterium sp. SCN 69-14]
MDLNQILFGVYPYVALSVLAIGSVLRFDREPYTWRTGSSQLLRRKQLMTGSVLFHIGVLAIFGGHFVGLLTPVVVWDTLGVTHSAKQMLAIVAGGVAGAFALVGGLLLLHRRLMDPRVRANSSFADTAILVMLMAQLLLGLATIPISLTHRDGHEMMKFMNWAQGVFTLRPGVADLVADVHWIFKAHLTLGLTILLVFPFTRLVHMLSAPIWYLNRRGWQLVRTRRDMSVRKGPVRLDPAE